MKDILGSILAFLFWGIMIYGEIGGIYHSVRKHSTGDVVASIALPPWAWYRSIELFWHDDFADVDWNKRLPNDMKACVYFFNAVSQTDANVYKINEDIEEFSKRVAHYPNDKKEFLKKGSALYVGYALSLTDDMTRTFNRYFDGSEFRFEFGERTIRLEENLKQYNLQDEMEMTRKAVKELMKQTEEKSGSASTEDLAEQKAKMTTAFELMKTKQLTSLKQTYKNLFNEEYTE